MAARARRTGSPRLESRLARLVTYAALTASCAAGLACTWVKLSPEAERVVVLSDDADPSCTELGQTRARTTATVGLFARRQTKVEADLLALAREEAVRMGGNAVSPVGPPAGGEQAFRVYRCGRS